MKQNGARRGQRPFLFLPAQYAGWSLIELVVVLVIASVLVFFVVRSFQPREALALQQAERLRNDIRNVQMLALTWNEPLRLTATAAIAGPDCPTPPAVPAKYDVRCVSGSATAPCNGANPVVNPATGQPYSVNLECGLNIAGPTLDFDALGRPKIGAAFISANASFTISGGNTARTVTVAPLTGFAVAQ